MLLRGVMNLESLLNRQAREIAPGFPLAGAWLSLTDFHRAASLAATAEPPTILTFVQRPTALPKNRTQAGPQMAISSSRGQLRTLAIAAMSLLLCVAAWASQSVFIVWDVGPSQNATGYLLHYGTASGSYPSQIDVGTNLTATISGLKEGQTNYFVVTAYNSMRLESLPSAEISFIVPELVTLDSGANPTVPGRIKFVVAPGHWYEVQATEDLHSWVTLWQTVVVTSNTWVQFTDSDVSVFPARFYRLMLH
jgi:hypothetical protein